jgi:hypothetical protein
MLTAHALKRSAQRGISSKICELLSEYGDQRFDGHGGVVRYFSKDSISDIIAVEGQDFFRKNHEKFRTYIIESSRNGQVITAARDYRKTQPWLRRFV